MRYFQQVDGIVYCGPGGRGYTLTQALADLRGCGNAKVLRAHDLSIAVERAGSDTELIHVSQINGRRRTVRRRMTLAARLAWEADMAARAAARAVAFSAA